ncbi:hypothetical protein E2C01_064354 [Portunus trituberculatus]|uniref:Uncharacterized protein n=1 Tax=Portunus trituberculatus TaxID=210409 RepID=A0A5B7HKK6_PORTR|nr:hypothetical protein [Portunus trituberculatus]
MPLSPQLILCFTLCSLCFRRRYHLLHYLNSVSSFPPSLGTFLPYTKPRSENSLVIIRETCYRWHSYVLAYTTTTFTTSTPSSHLLLPMTPSRSIQNKKRIEYSPIIIQQSCFRLIPYVLASTTTSFTTSTSSPPPLLPITLISSVANKKKESITVQSSNEKRVIDGFLNVLSATTTSFTTSTSSSHLLTTPSRSLQNKKRSE